MKKTVMAMISMLWLFGCGQASINGDWVQAIPGMEDQVQGIKLEKGGKASSINMNTLVYETWEKQGDKLVLSGKSIGNGQTIEFVEDYKIIKLNDNELVLENGDGELVYHRASE